MTSKVHTQLSKHYKFYLKLNFQKNYYYNSENDEYQTDNNNNNNYDYDYDYDDEEEYMGWSSE